ncbi:MAG: hypothetical protein A2275_09490 [Bacteroidetes bacterium RIFOXYA12_FULL_35_11]|nr:MAG: hypothetical protein A2X01_06205 [Bacteroidetes bacterium GWF2_35_48]OFY78652.1 MAG: hypothetical protein A2275_09490 [Bacteroidetes bacterium RIFOXYA12_FULL_35_11]OFY95256.1 MAG: hypothetical protein A2309_03010 [Bacteroidetes bacterium RIFOXYB2_FULL_35_7]OFZ04839.1 MAG: hypothetical protein A2491_05620 [Bacteroidetes bacterium RIFOXYC12_FULL_35_7]HBX52734.1 cell envelope integrity protein CreD [Bacteroidales bacterium]
MTTQNEKTAGKHSVMLKITVIVILIMVLLLPSLLILELVQERKQRQTEAIHEVSSKWGNDQIICGPVLTVPYLEYTKTRNNDSAMYTKKYAYFLPENLNISGKVNSSIRYRGIFEVAVFNADMKFSGKFNFPDFTKWNIPEHLIQWNEAFLTLGISDMRGIKESINFNWAGQTIECDPGSMIGNFINSGVTIKINNLAAQKEMPLAYSFNLVLNGSRNLSFAPLGKETVTEISSPWKDPKFDGAFLPKREISETGFKASWKILHLNRNIPQQWINEMPDYYSSVFGITFFMPADNYLKSERSAKYAILFITLTFLVFFFIEILNKLRVHPVQYALVGLGLCLFYLLLISLSEQIGFLWAYVIASIGIISLIVLYAASVFKNKKVVGIVASVLILLYSYIYVLLQLEDYALLMGSLGLFVVLAVIMYLSRKVNWYELGKEN